MKDLMKIALMGVLFVVASFGAAQAQKAQPTIALVVNGELVFRESLAGKDMLRQVEVLRSELQAEAEKLQAPLQTEAEQLRKQQSILAPEALQEKAAALQRKAEEVEKKIEEKQRRIQTAVASATADLERTLTPIYQDILKKHGANVILEKSQTVHVGPGLDVTTEVREALDAKMNSLKLNVASN